jgi:hypothetical protein
MVFEVEHLLHPLRYICKQKMLCSCNERPPKEHSPRKKSPPRLPNRASVGESIENLEAQETAEVAQMLNKVEWKDTPVFKQTFNIKLTEVESLKGTQIGFRRYREQMKTKGKTTGQIALDLKDERLRRLLLDQALKNVYMEPEVAYLIKIVKNWNLNEE